MPTPQLALEKKLFQVENARGVRHARNLVRPAQKFKEISEIQKSGRNFCNTMKFPYSDEILAEISEILMKFPDI